MIRKTIIYFLLVLVFASCRQHKELVYLQNLDTSYVENQAIKNDDQYKVQENDILHIKILSMNKDIVELFSMDASSQTNNYQQYNEASMYFQGYSVDKNGNISVPILGEIYVQDLSMDEINKIILEKVEEYIKDPTIIVKLANFRITLLGEIRSPGIYTSYNNQISIFQALSMGGDVTDYGNRKNVLLIRPAKNGSSTIRIDLTDKNLIASEYYYLKPNDLIYVEPMKSKGIRLIASDYGVLLATISSTLTTILLLLQL
ncbi:MAG: hypothetical protein HN704_05250 [Bacteroidetes bacterium]|jgi:polysaccharide biosynthesis/export protein|nr:hypothetical protein [Bacteroidota bacterium]MBT6685859.1 hypothetical protein [Bacteroidota bacterium]MBT7144077.1 hypothetical protein [Bacteroidota bacterium]MBT7490999.1 hypothetical protein [Bacteroidota bacterium]